MCIVSVERGQYRKGMKEKSEWGKRIKWAGDKNEAGSGEKGHSSESHVKYEI